MENKRLVVGLLLVVIAGAIASLLFRGSDAPKVNLTPYSALGTVAAEETSKLLGHVGDLVMVIEDSGPQGDPVTAAQLSQFKSALKKSGKVRIKAVERMATDPMTRFSTGGTMPPDQFAAVRAKHPDVAAVVLFVPFPVLPASECAALKAGRTKFVVVSAVVPGYRALVANGVISLAVVPKPSTGEVPPGSPKTLREWFDRDYLVVTPETAGQLPY